MVRHQLDWAAIATCSIVPHRWEFKMSEVFLLPSIGLIGRVFANGLGDQGSIPGQVIPKTQKNGTWCRLA